MAMTGKYFVLTADIDLSQPAAFTTAFIAGNGSFL